MDTNLTNLAIKSPAGNKLLAHNRQGIDRPAPLPQNLATTIHLPTPR